MEVKINIYEAQNIIPIERAQQWAKNWRAYSQNTVKAFLIPNIDVTQLLAIKEVQDIRAYVGIDFENKHRLMLVGVDVDGNDLINEKLGHYVYDFTLPCPVECDVNSPLYTLNRVL